MTFFLEDVISIITILKRDHISVNYPGTRLISAVTQGHKDTEYTAPLALTSK